MIRACLTISAQPNHIQWRENGGARTKEHTVGAGDLDCSLQPDSGVDDCVEEDILRKHVPNPAARGGGGGGGEVQVVGNTALKATSKEGESAPGVGKEN